MQAGSYVRAKRCILAGYPEIFERKRQNGRRPTIVQYMDDLRSDHDCINNIEKINADAKRLLDTFPMPNFTNSTIAHLERSSSDGQPGIRDNAQP